MTICIAAIFDGSSVVGVSDRMLTASDIEFEGQPKIWQLTTAIFSMVAGNISVQADIYKQVLRDVNERIKAEPENWWNVKDIAELYSKYYHQQRTKKSEQKNLLPVGLNQESFIKLQKEMAPEFVQKITTKMFQFEHLDTSVIVMGIDASENNILLPHIYVVRNGDVSCHDPIGFAAIGIGDWHANSHLMFSKHTPISSGSRTLLVAHQAKKKSQVAPGVGEATDMVIIGPKLGQYFKPPKELIDKLDNLYADYERKSKLLVDKTHIQLERFFAEEKKKKKVSSQQTSEPPKTEPPKAGI